MSNDYDRKYHERGTKDKNEREVIGIIYDSLIYTSAAAAEQRGEDL